MLSFHFRLRIHNPERKINVSVFFFEFRINTHARHIENLTFDNQAVVYAIVEQLCLEKINDNL